MLRILIIAFVSGCLTRTVTPTQTPNAALEVAAMIPVLSKCTARSATVALCSSGPTALVSVSLDAHGAPTLKLFADWSPTPKPPASMPPPAPPSPPTDATKKPTDATKKK